MAPAPGPSGPEIPCDIPRSASHPNLRIRVVALNSRMAMPHPVAFATLPAGFFAAAPVKDARRARSLSDSG